MTGVLIGFSIIAVIIFVGYITGRLNILGQRYERGEIIARDAALITTVASIPVLLVISALLR